MRRVAAGALIAAAVAALVFSREEPTTEVLVFARDVTAGTRLGEEDLTVAGVDPKAVPESVLRREEALGRIAIAAAARGEMVTAGRLLGADTAQAISGESGTLVTIALANAEAVGILYPGAPVSVVAHDPEGRPEVVTEARVALATMPEAPGSIVVAVSAQDGPRLAAASLGQALTVTLHADP